jgi:hypothetical protein
MRIEGACHCGNISYVLKWPGSGTEIPVRECGCTFCRKHGGSWTSHGDSELAAVVDDDSSVSKYRFGTATAEFYVCSQCGAVPFVISDIENHLYAVVNVNTFEGVDSSSLVRSSTNFDGEETGVRLERRKRNWIPNVRISASAG